MGKRKSLLYRMEEQLQKEGERQCQMLLAAAGLAFYRHWGWRKDRIAKTLQVIEDAWVECAGDSKTSMIAMCESETGVEIQCGDGKSWRELAYLNGTWPERMSEAKWIYMRRQQIKWIAPQIVASILVALHRRYGFGYDRCAKVYAQIQEIEQEYRMDKDRIVKACLEEAQVNVVELTTKPAEKGEGAKS